MEKNSNQKKKNKNGLFIFVLVLFIILVSFMINGGLDTPIGMAVAGFFFLAIIIGLVKITKLQSAIKSGRVSQPATPDSIPQTGSSNAIGSTSSNAGSTDPTVSQVDPIVDKTLPVWIQNIVAWFQKFPKPKQIMIIAGFFFVFIFVLIITISWVSGEPNTTITGTWEHELGTGDNSWIMTTTMWNVSSYYDNGYLYMNVSEDGTFTLTYNDALVSQGTWEERDSGYYFLYTDLDGILASVSYEYTIKGSKLIWYSNSYFTKK
ncbi:MAG: hypothetical protein KJ847_04025 [Firmicutes bacterium]|nr:hypothetical protein [Bacillota bacterium]